MPSVRPLISETTGFFLTYSHTVLQRLSNADIPHHPEQLVVVWPNISHQPSLFLASVVWPSASRIEARLGAAARAALVYPLGIPTSAGVVHLIAPLRTPSGRMTVPGSHGTTHFISPVFVGHPLRYSGPDSLVTLATVTGYDSFSLLHVFD
jgi:hypothetical protein